MSEQEEDNKKNVQADDKSVAVGDIRVGGNAGNINISNVTNIYAAAKEDDSLAGESRIFFEKTVHENFQRIASRNG